MPPMRVSPDRFHDDVVCARTWTPPTFDQFCRFDSVTRLVRVNRFEFSRNKIECEGSMRWLHGVLQTSRPSTTTSHEVSGSAETSCTSIGPPVGTYRFPIW